MREQGDCILITFINDSEPIDTNNILNINHLTKTGTGFGLKIIIKILLLLNGDLLVDNIDDGVGFVVKIDVKK